VLLALWVECYCRDGGGVAGEIVKRKTKDRAVLHPVLQVSGSSLPFHEPWLRYHNQHCLDKTCPNDPILYPESLAHNTRIARNYSLTSSPHELVRNQSGSTDLLSNRLAPSRLSI